MYKAIKFLFTDSLDGPVMTAVHLARLVLFFCNCTFESAMIFSSLSTVFFFFFSFLSDYTTCEHCSRLLGIVSNQVYISVNT